MAIYVIRHTTPLIGKGICYGQTDLSLAETFKTEFEMVARQLPGHMEKVYSSPLKRCRLLAQYLNAEFVIEPRLKEMNFGDWEMKRWDEIPQSELNVWMQDFVSQAPPHGESMQDLNDRVAVWWENIANSSDQSILVVTHAGVMRCLLAIVNQTSLQNAFEDYQINYGEIIQLIP